MPSEAEKLTQFAYSSLSLGRLLNKARPRLRRQWFVALGPRVARRALDSKTVPSLVKRAVTSAAPWVERKDLSEAEFRQVRIEPHDSFNWRWRKPHLDLVTDHGRLQRIGEIVDWLREPGRLEEIRSQVRETDTTRPFRDPPNLDWEFWNTGNNFFVYCVLFEFRRGVLPYARANSYIRSGAAPALYTADYYSALPEMSDDEIGRLLSSAPIEVTDGAVTGGKHREFAMIGRLVHGRAYVPVTALWWTAERRGT